MYRIRMLGCFNVFSDIFVISYIALISTTSIWYGNYECHHPFHSWIKFGKRLGVFGPLIGVVVFLVTCRLLSRHHQQHSWPSWGCYFWQPSLKYNPTVFVYILYLHKYFLYSFATFSLKSNAPAIILYCSRINYSVHNLQTMQ